MWSLSKSDTIADLQAKVASLTEELSAANAREATLQKDLAAKCGELGEAREAIAQAASDAEAKIAAARAEIEAKAKEEVEAQVIERLASAGTEPVARTKAAEPDGGATITLSEFNKLGPVARNQFIRSGGRLSN